MSCFHSSNTTTFHPHQTGNQELFYVMSTLFLASTVSSLRLDPFHYHHLEETHNVCPTLLHLQYASIVSVMMVWPVKCNNLQAPPTDNVKILFSHVMLVLWNNCLVIHAVQTCDLVGFILEFPYFDQQHLLSFPMLCKNRVTTLSIPFIVRLVPLVWLIVPALVATHMKSSIICPPDMPSTKIIF